VTIRLSDPPPAFCSACHNTPGGRYVDFDAAHDSGAFVDRDTQAYVEGSDDLHVCETCLKAAVEVLGLKAELHGRQLREIKRLEVMVDHWRDYSRRLEATLKERPKDETRRRVMA